jgi:hypothetical protein
MQVTAYCQGGDCFYFLLFGVVNKNLNSNPLPRKGSSFLPRMPFL